jgi:hypothetical protein
VAAAVMAVRASRNEPPAAAVLLLTLPAQRPQQYTVSADWVGGFGSVMAVSRSQPCQQGCWHVAVGEG